MKGTKGKMRRILLFLLMVMIVGTLFFIEPQSHTLAATYKSAQKSIALNDACYNNNGNTQHGTALCNGDDPISSGCGADATTVREAYIVNGLNENIGLIELRWSNHCKTNWARTTLYLRAGNNIIATIGYGDINTCYFNPHDSYTHSSTQYSQIWSDMIFAPTQSAYARGAVGFRIPGDTGYDTCVAA
jgi:hypothetical protein